MATLVRPPARSAEQRAAALARANDVRTRRAQVKRELVTGELSIGDVLLDPPECLLSMRVGDLVCSLPRFGERRAARFLSRVPVSAVRRVGGLTFRERKRLAWLLRDVRRP